MWSQVTYFGQGFENLALAIALSLEWCKARKRVHNERYFLGSLASCSEIGQACMKLLSKTAVEIAILCGKRRYYQATMISGFVKLYWDCLSVVPWGVQQTVAIIAT